MATLLAAFALDEGSGTATADASGNGNTGTLSTSALWSTPGKSGSGNCVDVTSAGSGVTFSNPYSAAPTALTIMFWSKSWTHGNAVDNNASSGAHFMASNWSGTQISFDNGGTCTFTVPAYGGGSWHHIAVTWDGTTMRCFVDGTESTSGGKSKTTLSISDATTWKLGGVLYTDPCGFIDDFRWYDSALTAAQITTCMGTPVGTQADPLSGGSSYSGGATTNTTTSTTSASGSKGYTQSATTQTTTASTSAAGATGLSKSATTNTTTASTSASGSVAWSKTASLTTTSTTSAAGTVTAGYSGTATQTTTVTTSAAGVNNASSSASATSTSTTSAASRTLGSASLTITSNTSAAGTVTTGLAGQVSLTTTVVTSASGNVSLSATASLTVVSTTTATLAGQFFVFTPPTDRIRHRSPFGGLGTLYGVLTPHCVWRSGGVWHSKTVPGIGDLDNADIVITCPIVVDSATALQLQSAGIGTITPI